MKNVALIPVRGGSKSIPLKNIREIAGKPLVYWTAKAANECPQIDRVFIATDNDRIKAVVESFAFDKVQAIGRSAENASDTASTEAVMLEFASQYEFDNIILIQATSPLLTAADLSGGIEVFYQKGTDSVLSVVRQKRFCWAVDRSGLASPLNYDVYHRPRRQEFTGYLVENGAFYITGRGALLASGNRISGNIRPYEMEESTYLETDEPGDWLIIEKLLVNCDLEMKHNSIPEIKMFLTDCDGCLTDGGMYYSENGDELKRFHTLDGMGLKMLHEKGIVTGIITGERQELNRRRARKLNVDIMKEGVRDKLSVIKELCAEYGIGIQSVAYIGDDINDLEAIKGVGFGCSVPNGVAPARAAAKYVTHRSGGAGAVREVADMILAENKQICYGRQRHGK